MRVPDPGSESPQVQSFNEANHFMFFTKRVTETMSTKNDIRIVDYKPCIISFYDKKGLVLLEELSLLAVPKDKKDSKTVFFGYEVRKYRDSLEKDGLLTGSPFKNGKVASFDLAVKWFQLALKKSDFKRSIICLIIGKPGVLVYFPKIEMTQVEEMALIDLLKFFNAGKIYLINEKTVNLPTLTLTQVIKIAEFLKLQLIVEIKIESELRTPI